MSTFPSDFETQLGADVGSVLLADLGFEATYTPVGFGVGGTAPKVTIAVSTAGQMNRKAGVGRFGAESAANRNETFKVLAPARGHGVASADGWVGADGGIVELKVGDTFDVPESRVGSTGAGTVPIVVVGAIELTGGHWTAEAKR